MSDLEEQLKALIGEEKSYTKDWSRWEITIAVPEEAGQEFTEKLFDKIADLAYDEQPEDRNWDVFVSSIKNPEAVPVHLLEKAINDAKS